MGQLRITNGIITNWSITDYEWSIENVTIFEIGSRGSGGAQSVERKAFLVPL